MSQFRISGSQSGVYEEFYPPGYNPCVVRWKSVDVSEEHISSIFRIERLSQARSQHEAGNKQSLLVSFFGLFFEPEYRGDIFLWNVDWLSKVYIKLYRRKQISFLSRLSQNLKFITANTVSFLNIAFKEQIYESGHLDARNIHLFQLSTCSPKISLNFVSKICDEIRIFMISDWATHFIKFGCKCVVWNISWHEGWNPESFNKKGSYCSATAW
jgi:hypothetical protein